MRKKEAFGGDSTLPQSSGKTLVWVFSAGLGLLLLVGMTREPPPLHPCPDCPKPQWERALPPAAKILSRLRMIVGPERYTEFFFNRSTHDMRRGYRIHDVSTAGEESASTRAFEILEVLHEEIRDPSLSYSPGSSYGGGFPVNIHLRTAALSVLKEIGPEGHDAVVEVTSKWQGEAAEWGLLAQAVTNWGEVENRDPKAVERLSIRSKYPMVRAASIEVIVEFEGLEALALLARAANDPGSYKCEKVVRGAVRRSAMGLGYETAPVHRLRIPRLDLTLRSFLECSRYRLHDFARRNRPGRGLASPPTSPPTPTPPPTGVTQTKMTEGSIEEALVLRGEGRTQSAIRMLQGVRKEAISRDDPLTAARALHRLGDLRSDLRQLDGAEEAYRQALKEHLAIGATLDASRAANDLGLLNRDRLHNHEDKAAEWFSYAIELALEARDDERARLSANNLGITYFYSERFDEALAAWQTALRHAEMTGVLEAIMRQHVNLVLFWLVVSEGGFRMPVEDVPPEADLDREADKKARLHFAAAAEAAMSARLPEWWVCRSLGPHANRCARLRSQERAPPF